MIADENERQVTQERIACFLQVLENISRVASPGDLTAAEGYRLEIERMEVDVKNYNIRTDPLFLTTGGEC